MQTKYQTLIELEGIKITPPEWVAFSGKIQQLPPLISKSTHTHTHSWHYFSSFHLFPSLSLSPSLLCYLFSSFILIFHMFPIFFLFIFLLHPLSFSLSFPFITFLQFISNGFFLLLFSSYLSYCHLLNLPPTISKVLLS